MLTEFHNSKVDVKNLRFDFCFLDLIAIEIARMQSDSASIESHRRCM